MTSKNYVRLRDGRRAHRACLAAYNSTIACGTTSGDCGDSRCCLSRLYSPPASDAARPTGSAEQRHSREGR
jgi:hypothetical protein